MAKRRFNHELAATLYRDGARTADIALRFGVTRQSVVRAIKRYGVALRGSTGRRRQFDVAQVVALYAETGSVKKVCRELRASPRNVLLLLRAAGVAVPVHPKFLRAAFDATLAAQGAAR